MGRLAIEGARESRAQKVRVRALLWPAACRPERFWRLEILGARDSRGIENPEG